MTRRDSTVPAGRCAALAAEWDALNKQTGGTERQNARIGNRQAAIEKEIARTHADTLAEITAKAGFLANCLREGLSDEAQLAASIKADLDRMAGRRIMSAGRCVALADEWEAIDQRRDMTDDENTANGDRLAAIEEELVATDADTIADILAKARIVEEWERQGIEGLDRDRFLARSLLADLTRLARPAGDDAAILALAEEYRAIPETYPEDTTDEEIGVHASRQMEIIEALPAMPAATPDAIKFKLVALDYVSQTFTAPELVSRFVASITADLDRMTAR